MRPEDEFGEHRYPKLLAELAAGDKVAAILLADDWQPIETYRPSTDYVFVKYANAAMMTGYLAAASRGWHPNSYWYSISGQPLSISPYAWKPIDWSGHSSWRAYLDVLWPPEPPWERPPEQEYEPMGTDQRLTPGPFKLLKALCEGAALRERVWRWNSFHLQRAAGQAEEKLTCRPVDPLVESVFIERIGKLPPGMPPRMLTYDWRVTEHGRAWLAANPRGSKK